MKSLISLFVICCLFVFSLHHLEAMGFENLGCYFDYSESRTLPGLDSCNIPEPEEICNECSMEHPYCENALSMAVDFCIDLCHRRGFTYSGLEAGNQCFCGNDFNPDNPANGAPPTTDNCNEPCSGDSSQVCGGELRIIIYKNDAFMNCSTPIDFGNGTVSPNQEVYIPGTTVSLTCNEGFYQVGPTESYCWYSGVFSHITKPTQPSCIRKCYELNTASLTEVSRMVQYENFFIVGDSISYVCSEGYEPKNGGVSSGDLECREDRTWAANLPTCEAVSCGDPGTPTQGVLNGDQFVFPNSVSYECNEGYTLQGTSTRQCRSDKTWSGILPTCVPVDCGTLENIVNGMVSLSGTTYGMTAMYTCTVGFVLSGDMSRTCNATAQWSGSAPTCEVVNCGDPGTMPNGVQTGSDFSHGNTVSYMCNVGYTKFGASSLTCQLDGQWSDPVPVCQVVSCGEVEVGDGVFMSGNVFTYNSVLTFICDTGYNVLSGDSERTCQASGTWSGDVLVCQLVDCGDPGMPTDGVRSGDATIYGSVVSYSCNTGYDIIGAEITTCQEDGTWTESAPNCQIVNCGDPGTPVDGTKVGSVETYGSTVNYECNVGYNLIGATSVMCQPDGSWSDNTPTCQIVDCGDPGTPPTNGERSGDDTIYGSVVTYTCTIGYVIMGAQSITCQDDGSWSDGVPTCPVVDCMHPGTSGGVIEVQVDETTYASVATYSCPTGYMISSANNWRMCGADGSWSGEAPTCSTESCGEPSTPEFSIRTGENYDVGGVVNYHCMTGYEQTGGEATITCNVDGTWSGEPIICTDINECSSDPCQNEAVCMDGINSYTCTCHPGFEGDNCETNINKCSSDPCQNEAVCMDGINSYTCTCHPGFEGDNCETNINECISDPCQNAVCMDGINSYTCTCQPGFEGDNCETNINECTSQPCNNGGVCFDGVGIYFCSCPSGFTGLKCETNSSDDSSTPEYLVVVIVLGAIILIMVLVFIVFYRRTYAMVNPPVSDPNDDIYEDLDSNAIQNVVSDPVYYSQIKPSGVHQQPGDGDDNGQIASNQTTTIENSAFVDDYSTEVKNQNLFE